MSKIAQQVREFHEVYGCAIAPEGYLGLGDRALRKLRWDLVDEEAQELRVALNDADIIEVADALGDLVYVLYGAATSFGIDLDAVLDEIHASNMSKLGSDGKPIYRETDKKVLKGPDYFRPNLRKVLGL